jgi:hypothetical protein
VTLTLVWDISLNRFLILGKLFVISLLVFKVRMLLLDDL